MQKLFCFFAELFFIIPFIVAFFGSTKKMGMDVRLEIFHYHPTEKPQMNQSFNPHFTLRFTLWSMNFSTNSPVFCLDVCLFFGFCFVFATDP